MTIPGGARRPARLNADPEEVGRGLSRLVIVLLEIVRDLLERQAIRRLEGGDLTATEIERLGQTLIAVRDSLAELRKSLGVDEGQARRDAAGARRVFNLDGARPNQGEGP